MSSKKMVYFFGGGKADGWADMRNLLGGKGANLAEMNRIGIPVPAGFTITTDVCIRFYEGGRRFPGGLRDEVKAAMARVEKTMGAKFGDSNNPLLMSVRSGARISMPGMMDTVLNIGLNDSTVKGLAASMGSERTAYDCYRRFIQMYGDVVLDVPSKEFEAILTEAKKKAKVAKDSDLSPAQLRSLVKKFKALVKKRAKIAFPDKPIDQLYGAISAVFQSWNVKRAISYRRLNGIPGHWGTAANVQAMVYGNLGETSATGVAFTRDPATGGKRFYGEYLINAQGEDVVAGIRTPHQINLSGARRSGSELVTLEEEMPVVYKELVGIYKTLEKHYRDMQDIEFTVQNGKLWMLQTRSGKRTAVAAIRIAVDMVKERMISKEEAVRRVDPNHLDQLLHPMFDPGSKRNVIAKGLNASPGAATGVVAFTADGAVKLAAKKGTKVILVRAETSPDDIHGMAVSQGILTARGGMTSHAAVVARGMGKCCVAGCTAAEIDRKRGTLTIGKRVIRRGDWISLDGTTGEVMLGAVPTVDSEVVQVLDGTLDKKKSELFQRYATLMGWADRFRRLRVRTNAETPEDSLRAVLFGAEGIGLARTEHMFFGEDRIDAVREMILADDSVGRRKALRKLLPYQRKDFGQIFKVMSGLPVTIRTLDPPLHEFLPHEDSEIRALAKKLGVTARKVAGAVERLREFNPMLGHRGCRLGILYEEITEMQVRAIMEAACKIVRGGGKVDPEIMIPLVSTRRELELQREVVDRVAGEVMEKQGVKVRYKVGTMIELPRAAITANEVAESADFFSFGTNDLTQTAFGLSRDDAGRFLPYYVENGILPSDPFQVVDQAGVGELMRIGVAKGRSTKPKLKVGICGEHGGEPASVKFCHTLDLDYVSCSPFRVPVARLAAAHAALNSSEGKPAPRKRARRTVKSKSKVK